MQVNPPKNEKERKAELSYLDITAGLMEDIESDTAMPAVIKNVALAMSDRLRTLLEPYSN